MDRSFYKWAALLIGGVALAFTLLIFGAITLEHHYYMECRERAYEMGDDGFGCR